MKLRLMGLRCTHLVSTKKPDARAFFGLQPLKAEDETSHTPSKRKAEEMANGNAGLDDDDLFGIDARGRDDGVQALLDSAEVVNTKDRVSDLAGDSKAAEQWWDCPICGRPQPADERRFNDHLDSCLSRQTIRDAVQRDTTESPPLLSEAFTAKRIKSGGEKRRGRPAGSDDPKQKKLSFG
jgi:DNA polymerase kappa